MAISSLTYMCVQTSYEKRLPHKIAPCADLAIGGAILIIGLLGMQGEVPMSAPLSYSLIGAGATYTGTMMLVFLNTCKSKLNCTKDVFISRRSSETLTLSDQSQNIALEMDAE